MKQYSFGNLLICYLCCLIPIGILVGVFSLFNLIPVYFNKSEYYGVIGLLISVGISLFCSLIFSLINFLVLNLGRLIFIRLFSKSGK
jgi:hypothetical protein